MKKYFVGLFAALLGLLFADIAMAIPANKKAVRVTQPDGTTLEIRIHGDEFLNWRTYNNRLISQGKDGFYYYADFAADGTIVRTETRVTAQQVSLQSLGDNAVVPPQAAIQRAMQRRQAAAEKASQMMMPPLDNPFTHGKFKFLCVLVNFKDTKFVTPDANTKFHNLLNQVGYSENGGTGSCYDFYYENSSGVFDPSFDVYGPVDLNRDMAYYGENTGDSYDKNPFAMPQDAIRAAIEQCGLDLTQYDNNNDGVLDNVFFFYAGYSEAEGGPSDALWPHKSTGYGNFQGISINTYACASELRGTSGTRMAGIGTFAHEFGHVLGLPDFYDTDYQANGAALGLGNYSLMSTGCYNNDLNTPPYLNFMERYMLSWAEAPTELTESGNYQLDPVYENVAFMTPTSNENEYFIYEYRDKTGWDSHIASEGILIYHVDQSKNVIHSGRTAEMKWYSGDINNYAAHQCLDLEEAVGESHVQKDSQIPFPGSANITRFDAGSDPGAIAWNGEPTNYNLTNIREDGSFTLRIYEGMTIAGTIKNESNQALEGVKVGLTSLSSDETIQATTNTDGYYSLYGDQTQSLLDIKESRRNSDNSGYNRYVAWIDGSKKEEKRNVNLKKIMDLPAITLTKSHVEAANTQAVGSSAYVGIHYSPEELTYYHETTIGGIEFNLTPGITAPDELGAFVYDVTDQTLLVEKKLESKPTRFEHSIWVDLSQHMILLDKTHEYVFGYYFKGAKDQAVVMTDRGQQISGGAVYSTDCNQWNPVSKGNLITNVYLYNAEQMAPMPMIFVEKTLYEAGDRFQFRLRRCEIQPTSVKWTMNGKNYQTGEAITLSTGSHIVQAVLTFSDGSTQTLVQEIGVL